MIVTINQGENIGMGDKRIRKGLMSYKHVQLI